MNLSDVIMNREEILKEVVSENFVGLIEFLTESEIVGGLTLKKLIKHSQKIYLENWSKYVDF